MKLSAFITAIVESVASDKAHKAGLRYNGGGTWANKSGETVAQTVNNDLQWINGSNPERSQNSPAKQTEPKKQSTPQVKTMYEPGYGPSHSTDASTPLTMDDIMAEKVDIGIAQGKNDGGTYRGKDGKVRYVKFYKNPSISHCENLC